MFRSTAFLLLMGTQFATPQETIVPKPPIAPPFSKPAPVADLSEAYERALPSFVTIQITQRSAESDEAPEVIVVSGFVIDDEMHVVTVGDPLLQARSVVVASSKRDAALARVVGIDPESNVALLEVDLESLAPPELGFGSRVRPGQPVVGIGNPFDLGPTASVGYVTGTARRLRAQGHDWADLLQLSLPVYPGEQGGPVVDAQGRLVGMVMTRLAPDESDGESTQISFALPIGEVLDIAHSIIEVRKRGGARGDDEPRAPFLGVRAKELDDPVLQSQAGLEPGVGCVLLNIYSGTPASRAGLETYDIVIQLGETTVRGNRALGRAIERSGRGAPVPITVIRRGARIELEVIFDEK